VDSIARIPAGLLSLPAVHAPLTILVALFAVAMSYALQQLRKAGDAMGLSQDTRQLLCEMSAEAWGTGFIVIFGVGSVCSAVLAGDLVGLWQVASVWGFGVGLAIYCTASVSGAHLNPAVSLALAIWRSEDFPRWKLGFFILAQLLGSILAAFWNVAMFGEYFNRLDRLNNATRGDPGSVFSAMAFGEYFPNPGPFRSEWGDGSKDSSEMIESPAHAFLVEAWGTFVLMFVICCITDGRQKALKNKEMAPFLIGFCVACLIAVYAPLTQAGWNPARDFGPRLVAWMIGYGEVAIPGPRGGFWVFILGPLVGAPLAIPVYDVMIAPGLPQSPIPEDPTPAEGLLHSLAEDENGHEKPKGCCTVPCTGVDGRTYDCTFMQDGTCTPVTRGISGSVPAFTMVAGLAVSTVDVNKQWGASYARNVMFLCNHNSCRSQMADAWLRTLRGTASVGVASAGIVGGTAVKEGAITVMKEVGVDISAFTSDAMADYTPEAFDIVISCCGCGTKLNGEKEVWKKRFVFEDWNLDDPPAIDPGDLSAYRRVRDEAKVKVQRLLESLTDMERADSVANTKVACSKVVTDSNGVVGCSC